MSDLFVAYDPAKEPGDRLAPEVVDEIQIIAQAGVDSVVSSADLEDGAVTTAKIADLAVTAPKLASNAVTTSKIAGNAISSDKLGPGAVTPAKVGAGVVTSHDADNNAIAMDVVPITAEEYAALPTKDPGVLYLVVDGDSSVEVPGGGGGGGTGGTGPQGPAGAAATIAVGSTTTGAAGSSAAVTNSGSSSAAVFDFVIPRGQQGIQGAPGLGIRFKGEVQSLAELNAITGQVQGDLWTIGNRSDPTTPAEAYVWDEATSDWVYAGFIQGPQGVPGKDGADSTVPGPAGAAATIAVGTTTTGAAGSSASVSNTGTSSAAVFDFVIPAGAAGADGAPGADGAVGPAGPTAVSADAGNTSRLGTDGKIFTPSGTGSAYTLPVATATVLGGVKDGVGVAVAADGKLDLTPATATELGGVKQGSGTTIAADGTVSAVKLTVDGVQVAEYDLDTTPLTASDVGAYTTAQVDSMLVGMVTLDGIQTLTRKTITSPKINQINDVSGNTHIVIGGVASAVNYFQIINAATGSGPALKALGTDASIPIAFEPKGTLPTIGVWTELAATARLSCSGKPTDVNLDIVTKGNGKVLANGVEVVRVTGSQTVANKTLTDAVLQEPVIDFVKTTSGNAVAFAPMRASALTIADPVLEDRALTNNVVQFAGGVPGVGPSVIAEGTDLNIPLYLAPKGAASVGVYAVATNRQALLHAAGPGTNHDLELAGKGTGVVKANGAPVATGQTATGGLPLSLWTGTKAQYDAIPVGSRLATTIYVVTAAAAVTGDITAEPAAEEPVVADPATKSTRKK